MNYKQTSNSGNVQFNFSLKADMSDLEKLPPLQLKAVMAGIAKVLAVSQPGPSGAGGRGEG